MGAPLRAIEVIGHLSLLSGDGHSSVFLVLACVWKRHVLGVHHFFRLCVSSSLFGSGPHILYEFQATAIEEDVVGFPNGRGIMPYLFENIAQVRVSAVYLNVVARELYAP